MSKFKCVCGEVIYDQTDHLPYKGHLFTDEEYFEVFDRISADIANFMQARQAGNECQWLTDYFGIEHKQVEQNVKSDASLIFTMIARQLPRHQIYQCQKCGRLHVEHRDERSRLSSFVPDKTPHRDIFSK